MLTVKQAAERAGVCESMIRAWVGSGQLAHYRLGLPGKRGKIAIAVEDLDALLASFKVTQQKQGPVKAPALKRSTFKHLKFG